jgi:hypothetical protein
METLSGDFNALLRTEDIFKSTTGKVSLHQESSDNGVRIEDFAT